VLLVRQPSGDDAGVRFVIAAFDGWHRDVEGRDAAIADATTLLTVRDDGAASVLAAETIRDGVATWTLRLADAPRGPIEVDPSGRWRLTTEAEDHRGADEDADGMPVVIEGRIGEDTVRRGRPTFATTRLFAGQRHPLAWTIPELTWRTSIENLAGPTPRRLAQTRLALDCFGPHLDSTLVACLAHTRDETFVWTFDTIAGQARPIARSAGALFAADAGHGAPLVWHDREMWLLRAGAARALRVSKREHCPCPFAAAERDGHVATLTYTVDRTTVALYGAPRTR
jgi:hypothetical protein